MYLKQLSALNAALNLTSLAWLLRSDVVPSESLEDFLGGPLEKITVNSNFDGLWSELNLLRTEPYIATRLLSVWKQ